jgi:hypothetical protein
MCWVNSAVGGINTVAVEIGARAGARIVWMPTFDGVNEMSCHAALPPGTKQPQWARLQQELREQGVKSGPIAVLDEEGQVLPKVRSVLRAIARHGLVLATGHLGCDEIFAVVAVALNEGVQYIIITGEEIVTMAVTNTVRLATRGRI